MNIFSSESNNLDYLFCILAAEEKIVELLIKGGADVNLLDRQERTPLNLNSQFGNENITEMLLEKGARDKDDALVEAASHGM